MSKIQRPVNTLEITPKTTTLSAPVADSVESPKEAYTTRVVFEANASADQMQNGVIVQLANAAHVFNGSNSEQDVSKGILTGITVKSIYSDCSEPVTVALNLYNSSGQEPSIKNNEGWLHTPTQTDFGAMASSRDDEGYRNLLSVMPFEKSRSELSVYQPNEIANDRYIQQYGNLSSESLYKDVVSFPGEQYYLVSQDHAVLNVIRQNWEQLGINVDSEARFGGKYVQIPTKVFDRVVSDLKSQVLTRMPFTNLNDVRAKFYSKPTSHYAAQHVDGANGMYKVCVELSMSYTFPAAAAVKAEGTDM
tara:strand:- start:765 stop:1682 length:918 start_codon:yes stop_codon:yes gene_type:complete